MKRTVKTLEVSRMTIPKGTLVNTVPSNGLPAKLFLKGSNVNWALELDGTCEGVSVVLTSYRKVFSLLANDVVFTGLLRWYVDDGATPLTTMDWDDVIMNQVESPQLWYRNVSYHGPLFDMTSWTDKGVFLSYAPLETPVLSALELSSTSGETCVVNLDECIFADESHYRLCAAMMLPTSSHLRPGYSPLLTTLPKCAAKDHFDYVLRMAVGPVSHKLATPIGGSGATRRAEPLLGFWYNLESGNGKASLRSRDLITQVLSEFVVGGVASPAGLGICAQIGDGSNFATPIVKYDRPSSSPSAELIFDCYPLFVPGPNRGDYLPKVMARTVTNWGNSDVKYVRGVESVPFVWKQTGEMYDVFDGFVSRNLDVDLVPGTVFVECSPLSSSDYGLRVTYQDGIPRMQLSAGNRTAVTVQQGLRMIAKVSVTVGGHTVAEVIARCKVGANQSARFTELVNLDGSAYTLPQDATVSCRSLMVYSRLDTSWFASEPGAYAIGCVWNFGSAFPIEDGNYVQTDLGWT